MAFAVRSAAEALEAYARFLHVPAETEIHVYPKSKNRVALFYLGGVEYQLCESMEPDGRFAKWRKSATRRWFQSLRHCKIAIAVLVEH